MDKGEIRLARAFALSSSLVLVLDADDGAIVDVNAAFEQITGFKRAEVLGKRTIDIGLWPDLELRARIWAQLRAERRVSDLKIEFLARDGTTTLHANLISEMFVDQGRHLILSIAQEVRESAPSAESSADVESYRALFHAAAEGLYRSLPKGGFIDVNPAMARIFGFESPLKMLREIDGLATSLYVDQEHGSSVHARLERDGIIEDVRSQVRRCDGSEIWILENARAVRDLESGHVLFYEGSVVDITERVVAEARLRESESLYRTLVDNCRDGVFLIQRGKVKFINDSMATMLGYRVEELVGSEYMQLVAPEWRDAQQHRRDERETGSHAIQSYVIEMLRKDGSRITVAVRAGAVEYGGDIASTGTARDVTEERRQQHALTEAERRYRELFEESVMGLVVTHADGRILGANAAFARILGYDSPAQLLAGEQALTRMYADPADRQRLIDELREKGEVHHRELAIRRRDGSLAWVEFNNRLMSDGAGGETMIGSIQDITARRAMEQQLLQSEARYRNLVDHAQVGVYMMFEDRYTYVNPTFAAMFGYDETELVGSNFRILVPPESQQRQEERYRRRQTGEIPAGDYGVTLLRKDGTRLDVVVSAGQVEIDGNTYTSGTIRDVTEQRRFQRELEHNATHDALTGLPNRLLFERELGYRLERAIASGRYEYAVLFLDLDGFKLVNDSLGHAAGDELLLEIARRLRDGFAGEGLVARYGGDEFTILPEGPCPGFRAEALARRVLSLLGEAIEVQGHAVFSGASLGIVLGHPDYLSADQILRDADTAMYRAKAGGKAGYVVFDDAMHQAARERLRLETDLRTALAREDFRVYYQPIIDLGSGSVLGCEALVRWQHHERGLLGPPAFLDAAEESGLIVALDWWVLEQACRQLLVWQRRHPEHRRLRVNVNLDERQFAERDLVKALTSVLERTGIDPACLALEVTETVFRRGRGGAEDTLWALKDLGVLLVVDDFGTGYSSLESFASAPFDALKIDRSFVMDMETNPRHRAIVRTITSLADELGLMLTAEGVETPAQAQLLLGMGCATAQGFLYAKPMPAEAMDEVLSVGLERQWRA